MFDVKVRREARKCERDRYKAILKNSFRRAGHTVTLDGIEFADEIVANMDLYRAGKAEPSLGHCIDSIRHAFQGLGGLERHG